MTTPLTDQEKIKNYDYAIGAFEEILQNFLLNEIPKIKINSAFYCDRLGEVRGIKNFLYSLTRDTKFLKSHKELTEYYKQQKEKED